MTDHTAYIIAFLLFVAAMAVAYLIKTMDDQ